MGKISGFEAWFFFHSICVLYWKFRSFEQYSPLTNFPHCEAHPGTTEVDGRDHL